MILFYKTQRLYFLSFVIIFSMVSMESFCQSVGEYRSVVSGNWITLNTWQRFNGTSWATPTVGEGYPGQFIGTNTVTIQTGHTVTVGTSGISTQPMGVLIIQNNAQLYLNSTNTLTTYFFNTPILSVVGPNGSIFFSNKVKLVITTYGVLFAGQNGLLGDCNNNVQIWIGNVQFAACAGAPGNLFTFSQVMAANAGGTLNAIPTSNSPICETGTINLTGYYKGAIGTVPTYNWVVRFPGGIDSVYNTKDVNIINAPKGTYLATLTVTTILNGTSYSNAETITVIVNPLPTLSNATQADIGCIGSPAIINLTGLIPNTTFTINYSINSIGQPPIAGLISNSSGNSSFNTPNLLLVNNGQILQITGITITSSPTNCYRSFSQNVVLTVWENGSWIGAISSDWNNVSNWCGGIPSSNTDVIIRPNTLFQPSIGTLGGVCRNIIINPGASLTISTTNTLTINGNWVNNGSFIPNSSTVVFNGSTSITGNSTTSFNNITINSSKLLTLPPVNTIITGNFNNNGVLNHNNGIVTFTGINSNFSGFAEFYNVNINNSCNLTMNLNSYLKIQNIININGTINTNQINTIEYSGNNQTIAVTNPINFKYYHLVLSGQGEKVFPNLYLVIDGDLLIKDDVKTQLTDSLTVKGNLTINNNSFLTLASTARLTVNGAFYNNISENNFVLLSDYNGTASLIHNSSNVPATVKRYISGNSEDWHFLSSPVNNQTISGDWLPAGTYGNGTGYDLYVWSEPDNCWIYKLNTTALVNWNTVHPSNYFSVLRGYLYAFQEKNPTKEFKGILNNDEQKYLITNNSNDINLRGFNLIGNPYPSSVDWQSEFGWTRNNLQANGGGYDMWIWNESAGNYGVCNSVLGSTGTNGVTRYIPPMQGFFIKASKNDFIKIYNKARVHDDASKWYKNHNIDHKSISISIVSNQNNTFDEIKLIFFDSVQNGANKLFSHKATSPSLFLQSKENILSVKYIIDTAYHPNEPLFFKAGVNGNYTLIADFDNNKFDVIMLEDCKTNYIQNLKYKKDYFFKASPVDDILRFKLHFGCDTNAIFDNLPARIFSDGININIDLTLVTDETKVEIFNILGKKILTDFLIGKKLHTINLNLKSQILIVKLTNSKGNKIVKMLF